MVQSIEEVVVKSWPILAYRFRTLGSSIVESSLTIFASSEENQHWRFLSWLLLYPTKLSFLFGTPISSPLSIVLWIHSRRSFWSLKNGLDSSSYRKASRKNVFRCFRFLRTIRLLTWRVEGLMIVKVGVSTQSLIRNMPCLPSFIPFMISGSFRNC